MPNMLKLTAPAIAAWLAFAVIAETTVSAPAESYRTANGMEVILKEVHGAPMIASVVFVKSGSKYETTYENGITHFLEHLLFDGTTHMSREELEQSITDRGGYINAFTRKELTAYLVLMPSQLIDYGMAVQADMLFNSVFPEDELAKERRVVIEEIKRNADAPGSDAEAFFTQWAYAGTPYARPVLGYASFIENIPRQAIIDYWKRNYVPSNMTLLIIGDFRTARMKGIVQAIFGEIPGQLSVAPTDSASIAEGEAPLVLPHLPGQTRFDTTAAVRSTYIDFSFAAPHFTDDEYMAFDLLSRYLGSDEVSPLARALKGGPAPLATEVSIRLEPYREFSRLDLSIIAPDAQLADSIISTVMQVLTGISSHVAHGSVIDGIKTQARCERVYNSEKLHFFAFMIAPMIMTTGWDFVDSYNDRLSQITWSACQASAREWLDDPRYVVTVVSPPTDSGTAPYRPASIPGEQVRSYFDTTTLMTHDPHIGYDITFPDCGSSLPTFADEASYLRELLPNGMTVIVKSGPGSEVFAMNVLGKNRTANEPPGKAGITDFVNRLLEKGTVTRNAEELARDLALIGARLTLYDNPWIPYDDRYTTPQFAFLKFETTDEFAYRGFHLFTEMILHPALDSAAIEQVRMQMLGFLRRQEASPRNVARNLFFETMFEGKAYDAPVSGTVASIGAVSVEDIRLHHRRLYSPENMILTIVTQRSAEEVMARVNEQFGRLASSGFASAEPEPPEPDREPATAHRELDKEQVHICLGGSLPGANSDEAAAIKVATSILSERLYRNLRERQGLAYSVGASSTLDRDFGWFYCSTETGAENYQAAVDGINLEIDKLAMEGAHETEIERAKNSIWGSLMRAKLSRINQAYYMAVDEYLGRPVGYDATFLQHLEQVGHEAIRRVTSRYFRADHFVLATAGGKAL